MTCMFLESKSGAYGKNLFERVTLVYLGRWHGKSVMTCMFVLSGRVELMVMHGGVKNNYEHNVVVMNLPCVHKLQTMLM